MFNPLQISIPKEQTVLKIASLKDLKLHSKRIQNVYVENEMWEEGTGGPYAAIDLYCEQNNFSVDISVGEISEFIKNYFYDFSKVKMKN